MARCLHCGKIHNVGFVATRLAGTDGVSLETGKVGPDFRRRRFQLLLFWR